MKKIVAWFVGLSLVFAIFGLAWAGTLTSNGFFYKPSLGARGSGEKGSYDSGFDRVDTRLGKEIWVGDPNYGTGVQDAISRIGSANLTLHIPAGTYSIAANFTVPTNVHLKLEKGALFAIAAGVTLTINGPVDAGLYQIFSCTGTGKVVFGPNTVHEVYPEWWTNNTVPGTTDMTSAIQAGMNSAPVFTGKYAITITFSPGLYYCAGTVSLKTGLQSCSYTLKAVSPGMTRITGNATNNFLEGPFPSLQTDNLESLTVSDLFFSNFKKVIDLYGAGTWGGYAVGNDVLISKCFFYANKDICVHYGKQYTGAVVEKCTFQNNTKSGIVFQGTGTESAKVRDCEFFGNKDWDIIVENVNEGPIWIKNNSFLNNDASSPGNILFRASTTSVEVGANIIISDNKFGPESRINGSVMISLGEAAAGSTSKQMRNIKILNNMMEGYDYVGTRASTGIQVNVPLLNCKFIGNTFENVTKPIDDTAINPATSTAKAAYCLGNTVLGNSYRYNYKFQKKLAESRLAFGAYTIDSDIDKPRTPTSSTILFGSDPITWATKSHFSTFSDLQTDPFGGYNAIKFTTDGDVNAGTRSGTFTMPADKQMFFSVWLKSNVEGTIVNIWMPPSVYPSMPLVLTTTWQRYIFRCTSVSTPTTASFYIGHYVNFSNEVYVYGANLLDAEMPYIHCPITGPTLGPDGLLYASTAPTTGRWRRGDKIYHSVPATGSPLGWVCVSRVDSAMRVQAMAGATALEVTSTTGMTGGDLIGVLLDNYTVLWTTIASITDGDTLVLTVPIPVGRTANVGVGVYTIRFAAMANLS
jgi:hypothetical protein